MTKTIFKVASYFLIANLIGSCAGSIKIKPFPEYEGVSPAAKPLVDEYLELSKQNHIEFSDTVTVGFKNINSGNVVGICTYGIYFREIDLDINYWNSTTNLTHLTLLFHELTHCYCSRGHDYGDGTRYPDTNAARIKEALEWIARGGPKPGRLEDGCPSSFMYPEVVDDECVRHHYDEYIKEMFNRCDPW